MPRFARCVFAVSLAVSCLTSSLTCQAAAPETAAAAFILMEAGSGRVLASRNETQERSIASTTKIMTCLVALEHSELTEKVTVKREHLREGSSMYLLEGETLTMEELLYGLMLPSGNDAAECIAAHCGGSGGSAQFVRWMNEKAKALGMEHTSFANPSGLDEMGHSSCALDMARLAAYAMQNPTFARIVSTRTASVGTRTMTNHNKLLASYSGCVGLKTGYTGDAGAHARHLCRARRDAPDRRHAARRQRLGRSCCTLRLRLFGVCALKRCEKRRGLRQRKRRRAECVRRGGGELSLSHRGK